MADFTIKQGDTSPALEATLREGRSGNAVNLTGADVVFRLSSQGYTNFINASAVLEDATNGKVRYDWQSGDTDKPGEFYAEWQVTYADGSTETFPNDSYTKISVIRSLA